MSPRYGVPLPRGNYGPNGLPGYVDRQGNFQPRPAGGYRTNFGGAVQIGSPSAGPPPVPPTPVPVNGGAVGADAFGLANPSGGVPYKTALPGARFEFMESSHGRNIVGWRVAIFTLDGGLNMQRGPVEEAHTRVSESTADHRSRGKLHAPFKDNASATPDPTGQATSWMTWEDDVFGQLVIAVASAGGGGTVNLFSENASTRVISSHTYEAQIVGLFKVILNGTTYLAVCKGGANAVELLSDLAATPTSAGSMHANTNGTTALQQMRWLPDMPLLGKSGTILWKLSGNPGALGTAPTTVMSNLVAGGGALGQLGIGGRPLRPYWLWAESSAVSAYGNQVNLRAVSTNGYGTDLQEVPFDLKTIRGGRVMRDGLFAHDGERAQFYNGGPPRNLRWVTDRVASSTDRDFLLVAPYIKGDDLYNEVNEVQINSSGFVTKRWREIYDWDLDTWQMASKPVTLTGTGQKSLNAFTLPVSRETGCLHTYADGAWYTQFQPKPGELPYNYRGGAEDYEASVETLTPGLFFPEPITYMPKIVTGMYCGGEFTGGGTTMPTPGAIEVEVREYGAAAGTGLTHAWDASVASAGRYQHFPQNQSRLLFPQIRITQTQGADTKLTTQALPIVIEGLAFLPARKKRRWLPW